MIVDEDALTIVPLVNALACCGYDVETASTAADALRVLDRNPCQLLVAALHMTHMDGEALFMSAQKRDPDLAVFLLTYRGDTLRAVECLKRGADDFLAKPYELMEAVVRIRMVLERQRLELAHRALTQHLDADPDSSPIAAGVAQDSLAAFISALESKDEFTRDHSARVSELASRIAREVKPGDIGFHTEVRFGGLLHDIGKIGIRESVINKPGVLTPKEFAEVQKHPIIGETILRPIVANANVLAIVRSHHERWDGGGYPDALAGDSISLGARIVAVADSYDAMTSARPYRVGMSHERAVEILREGGGSQWDRRVVQGFLSLVKSGKMPVRGRPKSRRDKALPTASDIVLPSEDFLRNAA